MQASTDVQELSDLAAVLASGAAKLVATRGAVEQIVSTKSNETDLVTESDKASEAWLVEHILQARPEDAILGEEGGERPGRSGVRWVIDPIDGTVNFVLGIPQFAVSVAAEVDGVVVAGAVCNPVTGELYRAARGGGAFLDGLPLRGPRSVPLAKAVIGTGFGYDPGRRGRQAKIVADLLPQIADIRRMGAAALDLCAVAAGRLDAYFEVGLNPWDYAAGVLIATEAGCRASGLHGRVPSTRLTIVAGAVLMPELETVLAGLKADEIL
ncbi:MAG TPA: inositol monophosphatase family protein [Jatrophihabitans sp.]|jgi:myo-inositol-1(or 4)-monophosphatase